jgi:hypothetical protein
MGDNATAAFRKEQAQAADRLPQFAMAHKVKPQQTEGQQRVISRDTLSLGCSHNGHAPFWSSGDPTNVIAGKGVLEIWGGRQRRYRFVRELPVKHLAELRAKLRASQLASFRVAFSVHEFELICARAAEPRHAQREAAVLVGVDTDHPANERAFRRPQVQQGGASLFTHLVLEVFKRGKPGAVFLHLYSAARQ